MKSLMLFAGMFFLSCTNSTNVNNQDGGISKQQTSTTLANLPSKYTGYIGCDHCDSLWIEFIVNTNQKYSLSKKYIGQKTEMKDSVSNATGEWKIDGNNMISIEGMKGNAELTKFKIITPDILQILDSTGSVMTDGKNYLLRRDESAMQVKQ